MGEQTIEPARQSRREAGRESRLTKTATILGIIVSLTTIAAFVFFLQDRSEPSGPPKFEASVRERGNAADLAAFLKGHDGEIVELRIDCDSVHGSHCFEAPPEISNFHEKQFKLGTFYLFAKEICPNPNQRSERSNVDCAGGWWIFLSGHQKKNVVYNWSAAGTMRIVGHWRVRVGAYSGLVGSNTFGLDFVKA